MLGYKNKVGAYDSKTNKAMNFTTKNSIRSYKAIKVEYSKIV